jgi:hypothetical protein
MNLSALEDLLQQLPFGMAQTQKEATLLPLINDLTRHHRAHCAAYDGMVRVLMSDPDGATRLEDAPFLPAALFKFRRLRSVSETEVRVTVTSSGTTGQTKSRIDLDAATAKLSARALSSIIGSVTNGQRLPMLIIDSESSVGGKTQVGARAAAILGLMPFGRDHCFACDDALRVDIGKVAAFLRQHHGKDILIFGFTFLVWQALLPAADRAGFDLSRAILLHSGGWKKLQDIAVDNAQFKNRLQRATGLAHSVNFYGMAELPGTVFLENTDGLLYPPVFADVVIRDPLTFLPVANGQPGLIQILSALPHSYPGHSLLTEDIGVVEAVDSGVNGFMGKGLRILGRAPRSELRGCSDVIATGRTV